jgi:hypothetical protein
VSRARRCRDLLVILAVALILAACATTPKGAEAPMATTSPCGEHAAMTAARWAVTVGAIAGAIALMVVGGPTDLASSVGGATLVELGGEAATACIPDSGAVATPPDPPTP